MELTAIIKVRIESFRHIYVGYFSSMEKFQELTPSIEFINRIVSESSHQHNTKENLGNGVEIYASSDVSYNDALPFYIVPKEDHQFVICKDGFK